MTSSPPPLEKASTDLQVANVVVSKLGQAFNTFRQQWQANFSMVESSLLNSIQEIEDAQMEVELRRKRVESSEREVGEWLQDLTMKERDIAECCRVMASKVKALEAEEVRVLKRRLGFEKRECEFDALYKELDLREKEMEKCKDELELRAREIENRGRTLDLRENELHEGLLELNKSDLGFEKDEVMMEFELKAKEIYERERILDSKEKLTKEQCEELELKKNDLGLKEKELHDGLVELEEIKIKLFKDLESKEKEIFKGERSLSLKEELMKKQGEELELKMKQVEERWIVEESKERRNEDTIQQLEVERSRINVDAKTVDTKEKEVMERSHAVESKEKVIEKRGEMLDLREKQLHDGLHELEMKKSDLVLREEKIREVEELKIVQKDELESKEKKIYEREKILDLKEIWVKEKCEELELKVKRKEDNFQEPEVKMRLINEDVTRIEAKEKEEVIQRGQEVESKEKVIEKRGKMLDLGEKQLHDGLLDLDLKKNAGFRKLRKSKGRKFAKRTLRSTMKTQCEELESKAKQVDERCKIVESKKENEDVIRAIESKGKALYYPGNFFSTKSLYLPHSASCAHIFLDTI